MIHLDFTRSVRNTLKTRAQQDRNEKKIHSHFRVIQGLEIGNGRVLIRWPFGLMVFLVHSQIHRQTDSVLCCVDIRCHFINFTILLLALSRAIPMRSNER